MSFKIVGSYPLISASTKEDESTGVVEGEDTSSETTKKITSIIANLHMI